MSVHLSVQTGLETGNKVIPVKQEVWGILLIHAGLHQQLNVISRLLLL
jgi:hypothetical protein